MLTHEFTINAEALVNCWQFTDEDILIRTAALPHTRPICGPNVSPGRLLHGSDEKFDTVQFANECLKQAS